MTDIHTILLSELNRNLAGSELAKDIDTALIERSRAAKHAYQAVPKAQLRVDVEEKRFELLNEISMLQSETFFKVGHNALLARMIPNILIPYLIDQGAAAYEARSEQDLDILKMRLTHFRGLLDQAVNGREKRRMARVSGILGGIGGIGAIGGLVWYGAAVGLDKSWTIPILSIPVTVVLWSLIGALAAMLYRFNRSSDTEMEFPLGWFFTRPVTGMVMGLIVYLLMKGVLIITASGIPFGTLGSQEVVWLLAFLAGFSDRFCDLVLNLIVGRLGGFAMGSDAVAQGLGRDGAYAPSNRTAEMFEELAWTRRQQPQGSAAETHATASSAPLVAPVDVAAPSPKVARSKAGDGTGSSSNGKEA
jgi:hypothetical protein